MPFDQSGDQNLRYRALLIGNARFSRDRTHFPNLAGPARDLALLATVLSDPEIGLHDEHDIAVLLDREREEIRDTLAAFFGSGQPGQQLLLYYSGHALRTSSDDLYLAAADSVASTDIALIHSGISCPEIADLLRASDATATVIILDCCHAGAFPAAAFGKGPFGILAGRSYEAARAATDGQASPFTQCVADALSSARARRNETGHDFITVEDVYFYVLDHLPASFPARPTRLLPPQAVGTVVLGRARRIVNGGPAKASESLPRQPLPRRALPESVITLNVPPPLVGIPPDHPVFLMSRHLVTNRQFAEFLMEDVNAGWRPGGREARRGADRHYLEHWPDGSFDPASGHYPVVSISALAAEAYLRWAGSVTQQKLRLPHLGEWKEAARAGRDPGRFVADEIRAGRVNFHGSDRSPSEIGVFGFNPYGIGDLIGNVRELCFSDEPPGPDEIMLACGGWYLSLREELTDDEPIGLRECRADTGFRCVAEGG
jgi:Sulfatase-modifying factor enzyme 1/Caspase domain